MNRPSHILKEFDKPLWIAAHFGFTPIDAPKVIEVDIKSTEDCDELPDPSSSRLVCDAKEKAAFIRTYIEKEFANLPHPLAVAWKKLDPTKKGFDYSLELVGFPIGIAEAKLIRTTLSILTDEGYENLVVEVNSMGDKDSIAAYERELREHARKNVSPQDVPGDIRERLKANLFNLFKISHESLEPIKTDMPASIAHLSSQSRSQFKEVLEYLEALGVEFRLTPTLMGNKHFCSETMFAVRTQEGMLLAAGYRYSRLSKRYGFKKELSLMGATVYAHAFKTERKRVYKELPRSRFYLVQLGREARMRSLSLIEYLRTNHLPIYHVLGKDKLVPQMQTADSLSVDYLLILGQKEAIDNTVTVRNVSTRAQDTIPLPHLADYLKHITLATVVTIACYTIVC